VQTELVRREILKTLSLSGTQRQPNVVVPFAGHNVISTGYCIEFLRMKFSDADFVMETASTATEIY
jgi:hypothetical protein